MGTIIDFNTAKRMGSAAGRVPAAKEKQRTPDDVRKFMLGIDDGDGEEDLHVQMTFLNIDDVRTAIVGDYAAIMPLIDQLKGSPVQHREHINDEAKKDRGPGVIMSVRQVVQLLAMMIEDGWTDMNPDVHILAEARYRAFQEKMNPQK